MAATEYPGSKSGSSRRPIFLFSWSARHRESLFRLFSVLLTRHSVATESKHLHSVRQATALPKTVLASRKQAVPEGSEGKWKRRVKCVKSMRKGGRLVASFVTLFPQAHTDACGFGRRPTVLGSSPKA